MPNDNQPMPMSPPEMDGPESMGGDFEGNDIPMQDPSGMNDGNSEIDSIFSKLDTEKQAAVIKYAKSMVDGDADAESVDEQMVTEITNSIIDDENKKPEDGKDEKVRNNKITNSNPFMTKSFNKK